MGGESLLYTLYQNLPGHSSVGEFLLRAPYWNLSRRPSGGEFLLYAPCWNLSHPLPLRPPFWNLVVRRVRGFSYTSRLESCLVVRYMGSLSETPCAELSAHSSVREFLLHAPCWNLSRRSVREECHLNALCCTVWSFVRWGVSLTRSRWNLSGCLSGKEYVSLAMSGIYPVVWRVGSFSYTPRAGI